jgi:hypothetical protein
VLAWNEKARQDFALSELGFWGFCVGSKKWVSTIFENQT